MFCYQCQETLKNNACTAVGICGKDARTSDRQDLLIFVLKGIAFLSEKIELSEKELLEYGDFVCRALFATITNANFDENRIDELIEEGLERKDALLTKIQNKENLPEAATWQGKRGEFGAKAKGVGILATENEDVRSLRELMIYGLKGISAYATHAEILGYTDKSIYQFMLKALAATTKELEVNDLISLVMKTGKTAVDTMALLDKANTETYGNPEMTKVSLGVRKNPGILISGHDLKDMEILLQQTEETGVDVYTHSEMLPAHYYPKFKKYPHFAGNYGNAWWKQHKEFDSFNGPILMTTNCITPVKDAYKDRIFTTGMAGYPNVPHIEEKDGKKDFSELIELAKTCPPPKEIETGEIIGGFAHNFVLSMADKIIEAVKNGDITRFVVMAGCDGRQPSRQYYTDVAGKLPNNTVILTAGCAKYRYNKLNLSTIGGIPRVLDAGQCNDSYSLAVIALKLKEAFGLDDVNQLPLSFDIAWYEQKAVAVLLALLYLGFKNIRLGPTLPAFVSPTVLQVLQKEFDIKPISDSDADVKAMTAGK